MKATLSLRFQAKASKVHWKNSLNEKDSVNNLYKSYESIDGKAQTISYFLARRLVY